MRALIFGRKSNKLLYEVERESTSLFYIWIYEGKAFIGNTTITDKDLKRITGKKYLVNMGGVK